MCVDLLVDLSRRRKFYTSSYYTITLLPHNIVYSLILWYELDKTVNREQKVDNSFKPWLHYFRLFLILNEVAKRREQIINNIKRKTSRAVVIWYAVAVAAAEETKCVNIERRDSYVNPWREQIINYIKRKTSRAVVKWCM